MIKANSTFFADLTGQTFAFRRFMMFVIWIVLFVLMLLAVATVISAMESREMQAQAEPSRSSVFDSNLYH